MRRRLYFLSAATIGTLGIAACDASTSPQLASVGTGTSASNASLAITPSTAQLAVGAHTQLSTNAPLAQQNQLQWSSSQPSVAAVNPSGLVTAIATGTATIVARYAFDTTTTATATITVLGTP